MILLKNHIHQKEIEGKEEGLKYHNTITHIYNLYNTMETTKKYTITTKKICNFIRANFKMGGYTKRATNK